MVLGALIARLECEPDAALAFIALGDPELHAEVAEVGASYGESPGAYVAGAAARYANSAGDEEWLALVTSIENAADPGRAALLRIVRWALGTDRADAAQECRHEPCTIQSRPGA